MKDKDYIVAALLLWLLWKHYNESAEVTLIWG